MKPWVALGQRGCRGQRARAAGKGPQAHLAAGTPGQLGRDFQGPSLMIITFNVETMRLGPLLHSGGANAWRDCPGPMVPVRGRAWTCTEASQARARPPFCLRPVCHLRSTYPDGTMVLAKPDPWSSLVDHEVPHPLDFPTGPDFLVPHPGALPGQGQSGLAPGPGLDHRSPPVVECNNPDDL